MTPRGPLLVLALCAAPSLVPAMTGGMITGATRYGEPDFGTGVVVQAGYFFKDTMFYSGGRGGLVVGAGKSFLLPKRFGVWLGAGILRADGTMRTTTADDHSADTTFRTEAVLGELGLLTPFTPFPIGLMFYRHDTRLSDRVLSGPNSGKTLSGSLAGYGWGVMVHLMLEIFRGKEGRGPHGLGIVISYGGLADLTKVDITTGEAGGGREVHRKWRPVAGESLRAGLEYEF